MGVALKRQKKEKIVQSPNPSSRDIYNNMIHIFELFFRNKGPPPSPLPPSHPGGRC